MSIDTHARSREVGLISVDSPDGPVQGLSYVADFRAEEEIGTGELRTVFTAASDPDSFQHQVAALDPEFVASTRYTQADHVAVGEGYVAFLVHPNGYPQERRIAEARRYIEGQTTWTRYRIARWEYERKMVAELRTEAAELGISIPRRTRKADLIDMIFEAAPLVRPNIHPAWFHHGDTLVLPSDTGDEFAQVVEKMIDAAGTGHLVVGGIGTASFGRGLTLLDERDLGAVTRDQITTDRIWYLDRMAELEPIKQELRSRGIGWYFLGNPTTLDTGDGRSVVRYWLNGRGGRDYRQPFGWYTLDELLAEKFIDDARQKATA